MKQYDIQKINELVESGKLMCQSHPTLPLKIYKYTVDTQFGREWNDITLSARGLVLDENGNAYTNPIPKFFNIEELAQENMPKMPVGMPYDVFDKVDGSCVEVFRYFDTLIVCTLGSFQSEQAKIAEHLLNTKYSNRLNEIAPGETWIFELVVPENRIVLNYGNENKLVLLTIRYGTGYELPYHVMANCWDDIVERVDMNIEQLMQEKNRPDFVNKEGFVIRFENGFRVKVKYEEYFRLHKIMTGVNERFVWEFLKEGKPLPLENVPDEFFQHVVSVRDRLEAEYTKIEDTALEIFQSINVVGQTRKEFALRALDNKKYSSILFKMLENKNYSQTIWDMIRPEATGPKFSSLKQIQGEDS